MATLTLIGEPQPEFEQHAQRAATRCLAEALAETAPQGCASRLLIARDTQLPELSSARASVEKLPLSNRALQTWWRFGVAARPFDGEFMHANTPMVPLRSRVEDDGSQTSVMIPHTLAWFAPELMGVAQARRFRALSKRAVKLADVVFTPTQAAARQLHQIFGVEAHVLPLAPPAEYLEQPTSAATRTTLELPSRYLVTTALPGEQGRLEWLLQALTAHPELPTLVILGMADTSPPPPEPLNDRVRFVQVTELSTVGAVLSGALLLALPQRALGAGYEVLAALHSGVPVLLGGCPAAAELAIDASVTAASEEQFVSELARLTSAEGAAELQRLRLFAEDRCRAFDWRSTAWQLWEFHATL